MPKILIQLLIIAGTLTLMSSKAYSAPLDPVSISYKIKFNSSKFGNATLGEFELNVSKTDSGYSSHSITKAQGMAAIIIGSNEEQFCDFDVIDGRAVPKQYRGGRIGKTDYSIDYDWTERKINFGSEDSLDMPEGYLIDQCMFWLAAALLEGNTFETSSTYVLDGRSKRIRGFKLRDKTDAIIDTALGQKKVVKVTFERELRPGRTLTLWLSPEHQYLPLQIQESRKSRTTTFVIERLERTD